MLVQRCALEQNRLIVPVSVTRPLFDAGQFQSAFAQNQYRALVDTGAQRSVLCRGAIAEQKLMRTGHLEFASLHGPKTHTRYLAAIALWVTRVDRQRPSNTPDDSERSLFSLAEPYEVVDMENNANFDMILGFDILKEFSFTYLVSDHSFEIIVSP